MSQTWDQNTDDDYDDEENQDQGKKPSGLRAHAKQLEKAVKERDEQVAKLTAELRTTHLAKLIESKGLDPKVASLVPASVGHEQAAVEAWVEEFGSLFHASATPDKGKPEQQEQQEEELDEYQAQFDRMNQATSRASAATTGDADLAAKISACKDIKELDDLIRSASGRPGSG